MSRYPSDAASQALRDALSQVKGTARAAVITLLGDRRDVQAADKIIPLAATAETAVANAATAALGKIGLRRQSQNCGRCSPAMPPNNRRPLPRSCKPGRNWPRGKASEARALFQQLATARERHIRHGALLGRIQLGGPEAVLLLLSALGDKDEALQAAAVASVPSVRNKDTIAKIAAALSSFSAAAAGPLDRGAGRLSPGGGPTGG